MRKNNLLPMAKKTAKSVLALSLATALAVPTASVFGGETQVQAADSSTQAEVVVPEPIKVYDFEGGTKDFSEDFEQEGLYGITKSAEVYVQKTAEEVSGTSDKLDANGLVYTGAGDSIKYHKTVISNQPSAIYDDEKGTVLQLGKAVTVPAIYKTQSATISGDELGTETLDKLVPITTDGAIQAEYTNYSQLKISNPFAGLDLQEYDELYSMTKDPNGGLKKFGTQYSPVWNKGVTISYWIKAPASDDGNSYKESSVLRWELDDQIYFQVDDYAKYLLCAGYDEEVKKYTDEEIATFNESGVPETSKYYFEVKKNEDGSTYLHIDGEGTQGPVYTKYNVFHHGNKNYVEGFEEINFEFKKMFQDPCYEDFSYLPEELTKAEYDALSPEKKVGTPEYAALTNEEKEKSDRVIQTKFGSKIHYMKLKNSRVRFAEEDGEFQLDLDNRTFWAPDNVKGQNENINRKDAYGIVGGMHNGDVFEMTPWRESTATDSRGTGTYDSSIYQAESPVTKVVSRDAEGVATTEKFGNVGTWQHVTITLQNDWVEFYMNGQLVGVQEEYSYRGGQDLSKAGKAFKRLNKGAGLRYGFGTEKAIVDGAGIMYGNYVARLFMDWLTDPDAVLNIGGTGDYGIDYAVSITSSEFSIDDLTFYDCVLEEDQIAMAYQQSLSKKDEVINADASSGSAVSMEVIEPFGTNPVSNSTASIINPADQKAKSVSTLNIAENEKPSTNTSAKLSNPFAGKELQGATIGYWMKQDARKGLESGIAQPTVGLTFMDDEKYVVDPKNPDKSSDAQSILYMQTDGITTFTEGYSDTALAGSLKNTFYSAPVANTATALSKAAFDWHYYTLTMTNAGIKLYIDGKLVENSAVNATGTRFLDGSYQRILDEADVTTRYGAFGGTNNQGATTLMDFLGYEDTNIYLGYLPNMGMMTHNKTNPTSYSSIQSFDLALNAEQVEDLYKNHSIKDDDTVKKGDLDNDGDVDLDDVNLALKAALTILTPSPAQKKAADIDGNNDITLDDVNAILKEALTITTDFK